MERDRTRDPSSALRFEPPTVEPPGRHLAVHRKDERRIDWMSVTAVGALHLLALLAFSPRFFSASGLVVFAVMYLIAGLLGVTLGYHRLLTHRSFQTPKWVERALAAFGCLALQSGPIQWVAIHRIHHKEADEEPDPHSPLVSFLWAHSGWLFVTMPGAEGYEHYSRFARDLARDPVHRFLDRAHFAVYAASAVLLYLGGQWWGGVGLSWVVWGVFVRTVVAWHAAWLVNSASHSWGYRNYATDEHSTNNWWVALLSFGEGWHNNHHADQRSAAHGQRWFEIDLTYGLIRLMAAVGLARRVVRPADRVVSRRVDVLRAAARRAGAAAARREAGRLHTATDPTLPVEVPEVRSLREACEATARAARHAMAAAEVALEHAAEAVAHRGRAAAGNADAAVRHLLEGTKDRAMAAVEQAKYAASQAAAFAAQASARAGEARDRAASSAHAAAERSRRLAEEALEAAARAADEISLAFHGVGRPVITSAL